MQSNAQALTGTETLRKKCILLLIRELGADQKDLKILLNIFSTILFTF